MQLNHRNKLAYQPVRYDIGYMGKNYTLETCRETKINGILFQQDEKLMKLANVEAVLKKMNSILKKWSMRSLTTLGKILILKTFGISQIIFLMQSIVLDNSHIKMLNACLYKFLWNKHFQAAKAPERIKREIINLPMHLGGFGMLDITDLDNGLKLRSLGRILSTKHPYLEAVRKKIDWGNFFDPICKIATDPYVCESVKLLAKDRRALLGVSNLEGNLKYVALLGSCKISKIISRNGKNSLNYFVLARRGARNLRDLTRVELEAIAPHLPADYVIEARKYIGPQMVPVANDDDKYLYLTNSGLRPLENLTSKEIRTIRNKQDPVCLFKLGTALTPNETITWGTRLKKLTSTRHKNNLLKAAHGEVYTREKLFRFKLIEDPKCLNCDQVETLAHKIYECPYAERIWKETFKITNSLKIDPNEAGEITQKILGATKGSTETLLVIHAEVLTRIMTLKSNNSYLIHPKLLVKTALRYITSKEQNGAVKESLKALLND